MSSDQNREIKTKIEYRVPYADTDKMSVVYYANYFVYFERLRNELIRETGFSYLGIEERGLIFPVIEAYCQYKSPARYDDLLEIYGWITWVKGSRFQVKYDIITRETSLIEGFTIHNTITPTGQPRRVPEYMKSIIHGEEE